MTTLKDLKNKYIKTENDQSDYDKVFQETRLEIIETLIREAWIDSGLTQDDKHASIL